MGRKKIVLKGKALAMKVTEFAQKRNNRLKINYYLARGFGYSAAEASIIMNQGWQNIMANAFDAGKEWEDGKFTLPGKCIDYAREYNNKSYNKSAMPLLSSGRRTIDTGGSRSGDVTDITTNTTIKGGK